MLRAARRIDALEAQLVSAWSKTIAILPPDETPDETPVLILYNGTVQVGELRWGHPTFEDTFDAYRYWDNPDDDGQEWEWDDITHWMPLPQLPEN